MSDKERMTQLAGMQRKFRQCVDFLRKYEVVIDCHMVEFFTGQLFTKVPQDLVEKCRNLTAENFQEFKDTFSLREFTLETSDDLVETVELPGQLDQVYTDNMNPKKIHEVAIMAKFIDLSLNKSQERVIIDAGSGLGYLSSWLAFNYNFKVLGIDSRPLNSESAENRLKKFARKVKHLGMKSGNHKIHTEFIDDHTNFLQLAHQFFPDSTNPSLTLTGLHTCGSLSTNCLRIFRNVDSIRSLFNIGCCYNLLEPSDFPMSTTGSEEQFNLTRNARMLAAYSVDRVFANPDLSNVAKIFYRALLEKLLSEKYPGVKVSNLGPIKATSFSEYVTNAQISRPEMFVNCAIDEQLAEEYYQQHEGHWQEMIIFYLFRMSFAPVIESVLVLDKVLYLLESDNVKEVKLVKLFDAVVSPRCYLIQANK